MAQDNNLIEILQKSPILATGLGVWSAAMLSYFTRDLPKTIFDFFRRQFTVSYEIPNHESSFKAITYWLENRGKTKSFRGLRVRFGKVSVGLGRHYFFHRNRLWWVYSYKVDNKFDSNAEEMVIGCFARSQITIREFVETAKLDYKNNDRIEVYFSNEDSWRHGTRQDKKKLETVFLPSNIKNTVLDHLTSFFQSEQWYKHGGIPFRTGLCFFGPPGTGKTSMVKALASKFDLSVYVLDLNSQSDKTIRNLFAQLPRQCLVLIEDIDTLASSKSRVGPDLKTDNDGLTLGGLLNAIDGVVESDGRVLVMTTNHVEKLDPALIRPGRCDRLVELTYLNDETFRQAFKQFFPEFELPSAPKWKEKFTPAQLQTLVLENKTNPARLLDQVIQSQLTEFHSKEQLKAGVS